VLLLRQPLQFLFPPICTPDLSPTPLPDPLLLLHLHINTHQILKTLLPALQSDVNSLKSSPMKLSVMNVQESSVVSLTLSAIYALYDKSFNQN
jgi:hypothetical protein